MMRPWIHRAVGLCALLLALLPVVAVAQPDVPPPLPQRPRVVGVNALQTTYFYESWAGSPCTEVPPLVVEQGKLISALAAPFDEDRCRWTWTVQGAARTVTWRGAVLEQRVALPMVRR